MERKITTIREIASQLGISPSAVSRALHDHPSIGQQTKQRVKELARALNYEPNETALLFKQQKTRTVGVILPYLVEEFFSKAISGMEDVASENGYTVLIGQSREDTGREQQILDTMRKHRVDGMIVSVAKTTERYDHFREIHAGNIPLVFFDRIPKMEGINYVYCNLRPGTEAAIDLLVSRGHRRIALINGPGALTASEERYEGFASALRRHKISPDPALIKSTDLSATVTENAMAELLSVKKTPTAILAFNDYVALDAIQFLKKQGLRANRDIAVVSFANISLNHYLDSCPLASVEQFPAEQGQKAMALLLDILCGRASGNNSGQVIESKLMLPNR